MAREEAGVDTTRRRGEVIEGLLGARTQEEAGKAKTSADRYRREEHPTDPGVLAALERLEAREWKLPQDAEAERARRRVVFALAMLVGAFCLYLYGMAAGLAVVFGAAMALEAAGWACSYFTSRWLREPESGRGSEEWGSGAQRQ